MNLKILVLIVSIAACFATSGLRPKRTFDEGDFNYGQRAHDFRGKGIPPFTYYGKDSATDAEIGASASVEGGFETPELDETARIANTLQSEIETLNAKIDSVAEIVENIVRSQSPPSNVDQGAEEKVSEPGTEGDYYTRPQEEEVEVWLAPIEPTERPVSSALPVEEEAGEEEVIILENNEEAEIEDDEEEEQAAIVEPQAGEYVLENNEEAEIEDEEEEEVVVSEAPTEYALENNEEAEIEHEEEEEVVISGAPTEYALENNEEAEIEDEEEEEEAAIVGPQANNEEAEIEDEEEEEEGEGAIMGAPTGGYISTPEANGVEDEEEAAVEKIKALENELATANSVITELKDELDEANETIKSLRNAQASFSADAQTNLLSLRTLPGKRGSSRQHVLDW